MNSIAILGAGPAGAWTALTLLKKFPGHRILLIEKEDVPGGITASFQWKGMIFDYGSHRLHPATSPDILRQVRDLLGDHLLKRPRHGRIILEGRLVAFPLKPADLLFKLPPSFSAGVILDTLGSPFRSSGGKTFREVLEGGLGKTVSRRFYFPYSEKLWGLKPEELSPVQAQKRIASSSLGSMIRKALSSLTGKNEGYFFYPAEGFGEITGKAVEKAVSEGVTFMPDSSLLSIERTADNSSWKLVMENGSSLKADFVFSTLPINTLAKAMNPKPPEQIMEAAGKIEYRSMVFCYLELKGARYTEFDAHYFPAKNLCFSRMSEPKIYRNTRKPPCRTGLCFEIPCSQTDEVWHMGSSEIAEKVLQDLASAGLPEPDVTDCTVKRKSNIYPVYDLSFRENTAPLESWASSLEGLVTFGRQGLFVHDNTHHTIEVGMAAANCLETDLSWNEKLWRKHLEEFKSHVVAD